MSNHPVNKSKFQDLMAQARSRHDNATDNTDNTEDENVGGQSSAVVSGTDAPASPSRTRKPARTPAAAKGASSSNSVSAREPEAAAPRRGRPPGKRSHPDFEQITAYISKQTHRQTKIALLHEGEKGEKREFSELVEQLLRKWLDEQK